MLRNTSIGMLMVATLKHATINKSKSSIMWSLWKGQRLVEFFHGGFKAIKEALFPSRWRRKFLLKAMQDTEVLLLRDYYTFD